MIYIYIYIYIYKKEKKNDKKRKEKKNVEKILSGLEKTKLETEIGRAS